MKSTINYYYNLFPIDVVKQDEFFYFWINEEKYYFVPFNNNKIVVEKIYKKLLLERKKVNNLILNKDSSITTFYKGKEYALLMVNCIENECVGLEDFSFVKMDEMPVNWSEIWMNKIDYLEYQVSQRALGKDNILNSFGYYVGLAENAIQYYNMLNIKDFSVGIQHKRVFSNNYEINYYNPINMLIDYDVRDIAEYIKFSFFDSKMDENKIFSYINNLNLNNIMMNLLFVRLIFPTYYFDHYEKLINNEENEIILLNIINKAKQYEEFLKDFYLYFEKKYVLFKIDWIFVD